MSGQVWNTTPDQSQHKLSDLQLDRCLQQGRKWSQQITVLLRQWEKSVQSHAPKYHLWHIKLKKNKSKSFIGKAKKKMSRRKAWAGNFASSAKAQCLNVLLMPTCSFTSPSFQQILAGSFSSSVLPNPFRGETRRKWLSYLSVKLTLIFMIHHFPLHKVAASRSMT